MAVFPKIRMRLAGFMAPSCGDDRTYQGILQKCKACAMKAAIARVNRRCLVVESVGTVPDFGRFKNQRCFYRGTLGGGFMGANRKKHYRSRKREPLACLAKRKNMLLEKEAV
jgi:hypothetical protein